MHIDEKVLWMHAFAVSMSQIDVFAPANFGGSRERCSDDSWNCEHLRNYYSCSLRPALAARSAARQALQVRMAMAQPAEDVGPSDMTPSSGTQELNFEPFQEVCTCCVQIAMYAPAACLPATQAHGALTTGAVFPGCRRRASLHKFPRPQSASPTRGWTTTRSARPA